MGMTVTSAERERDSHSLPESWLAPSQSLEAPLDIHNITVKMKAEHTEDDTDCVRCTREFREVLEQYTETDEPAKHATFSPACSGW